ncbi:MAG: DUF4965 domain-containing protein [Fimbriimonas sp.]|nr:DUF4965 domain-containing protein [Fimbriimonas sp.]
MSLHADTPAVRPPSVPLVTHTPYFSIWSPHDALHQGWSTHWTGTTQAMCGLVRVDGKVGRFMGGGPADVEPIQQVNLTVTATRSIYEFEFAGIHLNVEFLSPLVPDDLDLLTRPVTYLTIGVTSTDNTAHEVSVYFDCSGSIAVNTNDQPIYGARHRVDGLETVSFRSAEQPVLQKKGDHLRIDWGTLYLSSSSSYSRACVSDARSCREAFVLEGCVPASDDMRFPRSVWDESPVLALSLEYGEVEAESVSRFLCLAYDEEYAIEYFERKLVPYWNRAGIGISKLLFDAQAEASEVRRRCIAFDLTLHKELADRGGEKYAKIAELAFRQCLAAHGIVEDFDGTLLMFSKENFSNGCIGTVDVTYPGSPFFLRFNPAMLRAQIEPILSYAGTPRWRFPFAPHDLGTYPKANGQVYGGGERTEDDQMPVEECGNMLILAAAVCKAEQSTELAVKYWKTLSAWAGYLMQKGLDPDNQLCTDDFAGHLAHNANLSVKAIVALGAFGQLCEMRGDATRAQIIYQNAKRMADQWQRLARDGDAYRLAFDREGTWSQKYNLVWERLLGLKLFPQDVIDLEIAHYLTMQNEFGLPLDSRADYTKLDWVVWTATMSPSRSTFERFIDPLFEYVNQTSSRVPLSDWHDTKNAKQVGFQARSVVGGVYIPLLNPL